MSGRFTTPPIIRNSARSPSRRWRMWIKRSALPVRPSTTEHGRALQLRNGLAVFSNLPISSSREPRNLPKWRRATAASRSANPASMSRMPPLASATTPGLPPNHRGRHLKSVMRTSFAKLSASRSESVVRLSRGTTLFSWRHGSSLPDLQRGIAAFSSLPNSRPSRPRSFSSSSTAWDSLPASCSCFMGRATLSAHASPKVP